MRAERTDSGFSLIELMVAMVVTLIVSGAIYGLLASGQSAFRREPELADRQQNIRIAMAMIERDVQDAGMGLPTFTQAFTDGLNGQGVDSPSGKSDVLEIFAGDPACPNANVCKVTASGSTATIDVPVPLAACYGLPAAAPGRLIALTNGVAGASMFIIGTALDNGGNPSGGACGLSGNTTGHRLTLTTNQGPAPPAPLAWRPAGGVPAWTAQTVVPVQIVRYQIAVDPTDNVPSLWRSASGGREVSDAYLTVKAPPNADWQLVARGVEDLQVRYMNGGGAFSAAVGAVTCANCASPTAAEYGAIVRQVEVTLSALALAPNLQGMSTATVGTQTSQAVRGQLVSVISPRSALIGLGAVTPSPYWR